mmetsp:Transcript_30787/g.46701  ORF Transcript_30787/g.46701 Transcript_30787/m.46701 type:complete len:551 (-) Transcript_30787:63-1715(-)
MFPSSISLRARIANEGTEAEKRLSSLLFDDHMHVLSSFEMNSIASLSYEDETCEQIFDLLEEVMGHPIDHPVLAVEKSIALTKHVLIYGSEKCVNSCWGLKSYVERLCEFNTVIMSQQQKGLGSWWHSVKGGSVDKGFAVREASDNLCKLLGDEAKIQSMRNDLQDPNSLVPVGSNDHALFVSDEIRHYMLKKRMEEQNLQRTRSNLAKADKGFGSGFNAANGQTVVGAAHGLEEMLERAQREEKKFSETGPVHYKNQPDKIDNDPSTEVTAVTTDLLDLQTPAPTSTQPLVDLLDFGSSPTPTAPAPTTTLDIFAAPTSDLLELQSGNDDLLSSQFPVQDTSDLLSAMSLSNAPTENIANSSDLEKPQESLGTVPTLAIGGSSEVPTKSSIMSSNADRFAALDALSVPAGAIKPSSILSAKEAENRILASGNSGPVGSFQGREEVPNMALPTQTLSHNEEIQLPSESIEPNALPQFATLAVSSPPPIPDASPPPLPSFAIHHDTTLGMATKYGDEDDDDGGGFIMGGAAGSGLQPVGPAPAAPPPPPPL